MAGVPRNQKEAIRIWRELQAPVLNADACASDVLRFHVSGRSLSTHLCMGQNKTTRTRTAGCSCLVPFTSFGTHFRPTAMCGCVDVCVCVCVCALGLAPEACFFRVGTMVVFPVTCAKLEDAGTDLKCIILFGLVEDCSMLSIFGLLVHGCVFSGCRPQTDVCDWLSFMHVLNSVLYFPFLV